MSKKNIIVIVLLTVLMLFGADHLRCEIWYKLDPAYAKKVDERAKHTSSLFLAPHDAALQDVAYGFNDSAL